VKVISVIKVISLSRDRFPDSFYFQAIYILIFPSLSASSKVVFSFRWCLSSLFLNWFTFSDWIISCGREFQCEASLYVKKFSLCGQVAGGGRTILFWLEFRLGLLLTSMVGSWCQLIVLIFEWNLKNWIRSPLVLFSSSVVKFSFFR